MHGVFVLYVTMNPSMAVAMPGIFIFCFGGKNYGMECGVFY